LERRLQRLAVRATLPICYFDEEECATGIKALKAYRREWDEERGCWKDKPRHDWASNGADAFRYLSASWREINPEPVPTTPAEIVAELLKPLTFDQTMEEL
jgi:hypothetical protein